MASKHSQFNFGAYIRSGARPKDIVSYLPIGLFVALLVALAVLD